jgi:hypothetical protein
MSVHHGLSSPWASGLSGQWSQQASAAATAASAAIIGYFALAGIRDPHFELWGLFIKATQVVLLAALGYLIMSSRRAQQSERR